MSLLDKLRAEHEAIGPKVDAADAKLAVARATKEEATTAYEKAKVKVRKLSAVRDPLREEQMQLANAIGNLDPDVPDPQTITKGGDS